MRLSYDDLMRPRTARQMHHFCLTTKDEVRRLKKRLKKSLCEEYYPLARFCRQLYSHKQRYQFKLFEENRPYYDGVILAENHFVANFQITGANVDRTTVKDTLKYDRHSSQPAIEFSFEQVHANLIRALNRKINRFKSAKDKLSNKPCWLMISFTISDIDDDDDIADYLHEMQHYPNLDEALTFFERIYLISDDGSYVFELQKDCISVHESL